jgi:hypothetical protein
MDIPKNNIIYLRGDENMIMECKNHTLLIGTPAAMDSG